MFRAPICTTSAWSWMACACWVSSSSVTTGSPVASRAAARISSASAPRPLNANGEVRGLNAPPRSIDAPAALTACATFSVCAADSAPGDVERRRLVVAELGRGELVRAGDRDDAVNARKPLEAELSDALRIADGPDRRRQLA